MFISNITEEFFHLINDSRVLLLVNYDIDAICASKLLQALFRCESITYTLVPVEGVEDVKTTFSEHCDEIKYIVFVNCGGTLDIVEILQPEEHHVFFILDSHRPTDLCNVYSSSQVRVLGKPEDEDIPDFNDVFRESEDEDEDDELSGDESDPEESRAAKRRRMAEEAILKRRERRLWEEKRDRLVFNYSQFTYYGRSSALTVFQMARSLSKDNADMLWQVFNPRLSKLVLKDCFQEFIKISLPVKGLAILGVTEQLLLNKTEVRQYVLETGVLQEYVSNINASAPEDSDAQNVSAPRISYVKDFHLALYRHWTVESSVRNSMYTACKLQLWTIRGERKLQELFVNMGLPLAEARKNFSSMDLKLRQEFPTALEKACENYKMDQITYPSFLLQFGYRNKYSAADQIYALITLLESSSNGSRKECFLQTLDALSRTNTKLLEQGIERAKQMMVGIFKTVQASLEMKMIFTAGPFMYMVIQEGSPNTRMFSHPHALVILAHFVLNAYTSSRKTRDISKPLLLSAPHSADPPKCIIVGIPPVIEDSPRNFFGKAFEQAAEKTGSRVELDYFDASLIKLHTEDRPKFFDALAALLK